MPKNYDYFLKYSTKFEKIQKAFWEAHESTKAASNSINKVQWPTHVHMTYGNEITLTSPTGMKWIYSEEEEEKKVTPFWEWAAVAE